MRGTKVKSPETASDMGDPLKLEVEGLVYALDKPPTKGGRKVVVDVRLNDGKGPPLIDRADLYSFRARRNLAALIAETFGRQTGEVLGALSALLDQVERAQLLENKVESAVLTPPRKKAAEKLLESKDVLDRAARMFGALGYVGEPSNVRLAYLVATSRLLSKPLSAILFAPSGAGKSELLDKLMELMPDEAVEFLSRITPSALYYAGADHLRHKIVVVDEQAGAVEADYAVRTMQTKGVLRLAVPVKGKAETFEARGPIAVLSGTTTDTLNAENLSRVLELVLDDSAEQTERIQEAQRVTWSGDDAKALNVEAWKDAQRLLEPLEVVIPYAQRLRFPARTPRDRRENAKLMSLVASHALLFQRQRNRDARNRVVAEPDDYAAIYNLIVPLVERELDGLSVRGAALYKALGSSRRKSFTRRELAAQLGWSYVTTVRAFAELLEHELVRASHREKPTSYWLVESSLIGASATLTPPEEVTQ
jgi:hypothetical protein